MSATAPARPEADEYASFYETYVSLVPEGEVVETLRRQSEEVSALLAGIAAYLIACRALKVRELGALLALRRRLPQN